MENKGSESWSQMLILREGIASWYWLVSLLGAGEVGFYIASTILRINYFGLQNTEITHYEIMVDVMNNVLDGL